MKKRSEGRVNPTPKRGTGRYLRCGWALALFVPALLAAALNAGAAAAQEKSSIIGKIVSSENGEALPFANLVLTRINFPGDSLGTPAGGAMTMTDGSYRIVAEPGFYRLLASYIGYHTRKVVDIEVKGSEPTVLNLDLTPTAIQVGTVEVTAKAIQNTEVSLLARQKKSAAVSDGVSAEQIGKSTDGNAAEVLQRVTGLSIVDGKYVYVSGLGERYSSTQLNGAAVGTPEPNKRVLPLDLFAAGLLENVVIQKTYTPDQPGEFGGGLVNVSTRDFPGREMWDLSLSSGYGVRTTGKDFYTYDGGSRDFLGFDDGTREIPALVRQMASGSKITPRSYLDSLQGLPGFDKAAIAAMGRAFNKTWTRKKESGSPAYSFSGSYGNELKLREQPLGFLGSISYSNGAKTSKGVRRFYKVTGDSLAAETDYAVNSSETSVLWGALGNASYRLNDCNTLSVRSMYNRSSEDMVRFYEGDNQDGGKPVYNERFQYVERGLFSGTVASNHFLAFLGGATLDLRFNYSKARRSEPDRREYTKEYQAERYTPIYNDDDDIVGWDTIPGQWTLAVRSASRGLTRMYGEMDEEERSPEAHLTVPFDFQSLEARFKTGGVIRNRDRNSSWRRFWLAPPTTWSSSTEQNEVLSLPLEEMLTDERIGGTSRQFVLTELTRSERDNYLAHGDIRAAYTMLDLPVRRTVRLVAGARVEQAEMRVNPYDIFHLVPDSLLKRARLDNTDWLPSVNVTWTPHPELNARFAYSATVSRPDFRELSEQSFSDFVDDYEQFGNPDLKRAMIHSYDLRVESFPKVSEIVAGSLFYKDLVNPIEYSIGQGNSGAVYKPVNADEGHLYGLEVEARVGLNRVNDLLGTASGLVDQMGASFNYSWIRSETKIGDQSGGSATSLRRPLEGQSPYVVNAGLYFATASGRTSLSVLYNKLGRRLSAVGLVGLPDIYEEPRTNLDLSASQRLGRYKIKMAMENLLDDEVRFVQKQKEVRNEDGSIKVPGRDKVARSTDSGRTFSVSISMGA